MVLHIEITGGIGGIEIFLLNLYKNIDREQIQFDFVTSSNFVPLKENFHSLGGDVYKIASPVHILQYWRNLRNLIETNQYEIVHIHKNSAANLLPFIICKLLGVKVIVSHAHNTSSTKGTFFNVLHKINRQILTQIQTNAFACSKAAAQWLYGKGYTAKNNVSIFKNGVEVKNFVFNEFVRNEMRASLNLQDLFVIGHVGRFTKQKNHIFLIDIFAEIIKYKANAVLLLCGLGELEKQVKEKVFQLGLDKRVFFLGERKDVNKIMQAMDVFVFPSLHEGLPFVGIEAQAAGLPIFMADTISSEVKISNLVTFLSLKDTVEIWAKKIIETSACIKRTNMATIIGEQGYDIERTAKYLEDFYIKNSFTGKNNA